jgi:uncharacterized protein involved in exopolysaccharide biosynthesis
VRSKRATLKALERGVGAADSETAALKHEAMLQNYSTLQAELMRTELQQMKTELRAKSPKLNTESNQLEVSEKLLEDSLATDGVVRDLEARIAKLEQMVAEIERRLKDEDDPALAVPQKRLESARAALERRREELRPEIEKRLRQHAEQNAKTEIADMETEVEMLKEQASVLRSELEKQRAQLENMGRDSIELAFLRKEMDHAEDMYDRAMAELITIRVEEQAPPRITVMQRAMARKSKATER